jgi:WhiB family redox-sensing transcriptional regulator
MDELTRDTPMAPDSPARASRSRAGKSESTYANLGWLSRAACADLPVDAFFVPPGSNINSSTLKICRGCPVRPECVQHVYDKEIEYGYFGGLSPSQRTLYTVEEALILIDEGEL